MRKPVRRLFDAPCAIRSLLRHARRVCRKRLQQNARTIDAMHGERAGQRVDGGAIGSDDSGLHA